MGRILEVKSRADWVALKAELKEETPVPGQIEPLWPQFSQELLLPSTVEQSGLLLFKGLACTFVGVVGLFVFGLTDTARLLRSIWRYDPYS